MTALPTLTARPAAELENDPAMEDGEQPPSMRSDNVLVTTQSGAVALITPLAEQIYRRLGALQNHLIGLLDHPCGLNPRAFRAVQGEGLGGRGVLDGQILLQWHMLSSQRKAEACARVGVDGLQMQEDLAMVGGTSLAFF